MSVSFLRFCPVPVLLAFAAIVARGNPASAAANDAAPATSPITTVTDAAARWPELTDIQPAVRLDGVVTATMPSGAFRMHDGELGIYVSKSEPGKALQPGQRVLVAGVLRTGGFSPWIAPQEISVLGTAPFPKASGATFSLLASGAADNQWVEIEGVVRAVDVLDPPDFIELDVGMAGGSLRVLLNYSPRLQLESLVDAEVRMLGVAAVNINKHGHVVEPSFRVPNISQIIVTQPAAADPFAQPLVPVREMMGVSPHSQLRHRVRTAGVVTRRFSDTLFFLRDGALGLKVQTRQPVPLQPGDRVEVAGFPMMSEGMAVSQHSVVRRIGGGAAPRPTRPTLEALLDGSHNSDLVNIQARLVDWTASGQSVSLILQAGEHVFSALLPRPAAEPLELPHIDSLVSVTGICAIDELEEIWFYRPRSFLLLVAELTDVQVVQAPPWWTAERLWRALAIACVVLLAATGWVWALRRQIERKRAIIEQQARHAAALEERSRIARELHDTLEQGLTGLSLQMKAMETELDAQPHPVRTRLNFARRMLRQSRALARNAIRELRDEMASNHGEGLVDGLQRIADSWRSSGVLTVELRTSGCVRPLSPSVQQEMLGIGTEAMTNAVKHGRAEAIELHLEFRAAELVLRIRDNGVGFVPAPELERSSGCFGLLGMRERAREIGAELRIDSQPGHGTEITATVHLDPVAHASTRAGTEESAENLFSGNAAAT